jgi:hypothetical protein
MSKKLIKKFSRKAKAYSELQHQHVFHGSQLIRSVGQSVIQMNANSFSVVTYTNLASKLHFSCHIVHQIEKCPK